MPQYRQITSPTVEAYQWDGVKVEVDAPLWVQDAVWGSVIRLDQDSCDAVLNQGYENVMKQRTGASGEFGPLHLVIPRQVREGCPELVFNDSVVAPGDYLMTEHGLIFAVRREVFEMEYEKVVAS